MPIEESQLFDIWNVVANELIGDTWITVFIIVLAVIFITIKYKMPFEVQSLFIVLALSMVFSEALSLEIIWLFLVLYVLTLSYWYYAKTIE